MPVADSLIQQNQEEFGHNHDPQETRTRSKYFYVESAGKKRTRRQTQEKVLEGSAAVKKV